MTTSDKTQSTKSKLFFPDIISSILLILTLKFMNFNGYECHFI